MTVFDPVTYKQTTRDQWRAAIQARYKFSPLMMLARLQLAQSSGLIGEGRWERRHAAL